MNCLASILPQADAEKLLKQIKQVKAMGLTPSTFMDFDGTIVQGDVVEGTPFTGLDEILIGLGFSSCFPAGDFARFKHQYDTMYGANSNQGLALGLTVFNGANVNEIEEAVLTQYKEVYSKFFWQKMVDLLNCLRSLGVKNYVVTASPTIFIRAAKSFLSIDGVYGVDVEISNGALTNKITAIPYNLGKRSAVESILAKNKSLVPVLGAGNTINGDYPMLSLILGLGGSGIFVLDPPNYSMADEVLGLGLIPLLVEALAPQPPFTPSPKCHCSCKPIRCSCDKPGFFSCDPIIPKDIYTVGEIAVRAI